MTKLAIGINLDRCIGCHTCANACKMQNNVPDGMLWNRVITEGCDATRQRWDKLSQLVAILASPEGHTEQELADLDNDAGDVTDPAIYLTRALSASAANK